GLDAGRAEVARQFLSRAPQLDRQLRQQMAYRIAGDVVSRIAPPPPPGAPPELVLAAVLAERHRRELGRLRPAMPATPRPPGSTPSGAPSWPRWQPQPGPAQPATWPEESGGFSPPR
ncbi:MAG TPA: RDD family protein, partial [Mycobacterium sp.]|nr:RDD family protein [Mycobacterium sp.]